MPIGPFDELVKLNQAIDAILEAMDDVDPTTDDNYIKLTDQLTKLIKDKQILVELQLKAEEAHYKRDEADNLLSLKNRELSYRMQESEESYALKKRELDMKLQDLEKPDRVSKETWAVISANLAGIVMIIAHERVNVIASKALSFIMRAR
jgi:hypothetical protein